MKRFCVPFYLLAALGLAAVPAAANTITANFNGTAVPSGDYLYFNSVVKLTGSVPSSPFTLYGTGGVITFSDGSTSYTLNVPDAAITFDSTLPNGQSITSFNGSQFITSENPTSSGNDFLASYVLALPAGLSGGIKSVSWNENFSSSVAGVTGNWQWAAAAYSSLTTSYNSLGIKASDDTNATPYSNSDHAGTPELYKSFVIGGGTGGGGSNYTGSYSATSSFTASAASSTPEPSTVAMLSIGGALMGLAGLRRKSARN